MSISIRQLVVLNVLKRRWYLFFYRIYKIHGKTAFFFPHPNCKVDKYDVIKYHSDNVLCVVNYLLRSRQYNNYHLFTVIYDESAKERFENYCKQLNPDLSITFIGIQDPQIIKIAAGCELYFTDTTAHNTLFKKKAGQTVVDLGYFVPFKNLYISDRCLRQKAIKKNKVIDYSITTADLPAKILSLSFGLPLENILTLGLCRNDIFYDSDNALKERLGCYLKKQIKKLVIYVPTWRNYEYRDGANKKSFNRGLFGYEDHFNDIINNLLSEKDAVLIAKLHPLQCNVDVRSSKRDNIILYQDVEKVLQCSLYQLLNIADGMITDYTTTYWDFLNKDKPVIFNFYDFEKYSETRGFSFNPIEFFCAGRIVKNGNGLVEALTEILDDQDCFVEERQKLRSLFDCNCDGNSTKRVVERFFE